ncbi:meiosis-specific protein MEI4 [Etheostoma cragini]|uniref:meiosis-specific protein MEI4 n=1 Tax=Etheostoma cragini TaxID=417921 RepID=UPI00155EF7B0|nr:meiosis-specific protein MEI4 [Etheostoma cragini]
MDSKDNHSKGVSKEEWFFLKAKAALAVAIIKNRPSGVSSREYAEALACKLRSQDGSWRVKAQGLEQEVLKLRQELLITRVTNTKSTTEAAGQDNTMYIASQDLFGPGSEVYSAEPQPASDSETPELLQLEPQPAAAFPPPPVPLIHYGTAVLSYEQFLQSLCALHRVEENNQGLESLWFSPDGGAGSVLVDSVCQLLDSVVAACRDPLPLGPRDQILTACQVAARAMDLFCSQRLPSVEFTRCVEESLSELTWLLLHSNQLSKLQPADKLMEYLITLGSCSMSQSFLIRHILAQISALADQLWQAFQGQESLGLSQFPVDQYHNSCYLFWILEELLQKSKVPCTVDLGSDQTGFMKHLEQRVFQLSEEFPLFFICMWRLGALFTPSDR